ncbi:hypothetical protein BKH43_01490 [Helicobacter sp. 13S00401-1]|uniref:hypothetical protein n=1 Tax=Helicobacter sp. 13S00401-1 TaxID=1905758 RepID=UPI000BA5D4DC|nr:hypothetical protein [Helicobacter sp. 13S00401-1]PAF51339.1 hypothetical protein BKH43_01490 [Helicobacter sp. 13S00401-1]
MDYLHSLSYENFILLIIGIVVCFTFIMVLVSLQVSYSLFKRLNIFMHNDLLIIGGWNIFFMLLTTTIFPLEYKNVNYTAVSVHIYAISFVLLFSNLLSGIKGPILRVLASLYFIVFISYITKDFIGNIYDNIAAFIMLYIIIKGFASFVETKHGNGKLAVYSLFLSVVIFLLCFFLGFTYGFLFSSVLVGAILGFMVFNILGLKVVLNKGGAYFMGFILFFLVYLLVKVYDLNLLFLLAVFIYPLCLGIKALARLKFLASSSVFLSFLYLVIVILAFYFYDEILALGILSAIFVVVYVISSFIFKLIKKEI